jgi:D-aminoacyl-tRNA deacylase
MRAVIQRVLEARVEVSGQIVSAIGKGLLLYLGVGQSDKEADADYLVGKTLGLRIFEDELGKMNLSLIQVKGSLLVVSQFTLLGDCRRGKRPSFDRAASPQDAQRLYDYFVDSCQRLDVSTRTGVFREMMRVYSVNDGPVTILLDSRKEF